MTFIIAGRERLQAMAMAGHRTACFVSRNVLDIIGKFPEMGGTTKSSIYYHLLIYRLDGFSIQTIHFGVHPFMDTP